MGTDADHVQFCVFVVDDNQRGNFQQRRQDDLAAGTVRKRKIGLLTNHSWSQLKSADAEAQHLKGLVLSVMTSVGLALQTFRFEQIDNLRIVS